MSIPQTQVQISEVDVDIPDELEQVIVHVIPEVQVVESVPRPLVPQTAAQLEAVPPIVFLRR